MPTLITHWQRALALLDQALDLLPEQRDAWLADTAASEPEAALLLRELLAAHSRVETQDLLATLPKVVRTPALAEGGAAGMSVGPFELIEPLGRGGMGSVWRARYADGRLKRDVAIKLPASTDDPVALATLRERFARERDFLAQLQHPHIARLYDAGVSDTGQPFLAMEYVAGQPIDAHSDALRLTVKARLQLFDQVLDAVACAHQQLVLHRDLKADNVLVDAQGQVRLLDFGVARLLPPPEAGRADGAADTGLTERGGAAFTLGYAAPEQVTHGTLSTATDVYALGVLLYRLLTGLSPYQPARDTRGALEDAVVLVAPQAASTRAFTPQALQARQCSEGALRKLLRNDLDVILAKALKKLPGERYTTVPALADDLRRHLAQQPISAQPDSWRYRSGLFVARHKVAVAASAFTVVALMSTTGVAAWQAKVSADNAARASREAARANTAQKFFAGLLSNADPEKNKSITAIDRKVLDQALATAEKDFADAPETLALVLKQLADIYFRLGVAGRQLEVQKKRVALLATLPNATADEVLDAQLALGWALGYSADASERARALPMLKAALVQATAGRASPELMVKLLCAIADSQSSDLQLVEADATAARAVAHAERHLPDPHPLLAFAYEARGVTAGRLGQFQAARASFRRSIAVDSTGKGRGAVDQLTTRSNLANMEYDAGQYRQALQEAQDALAFAARTLGPTDSTLTPLRVRAVFAAERAGELDEAARLAEQLLAPDLNSGDGFRAGRALFAQAVVAAAQGDLAAASRAFSAAEPGLSTSPGWRRALTLQQSTLALRGQRADAALELLQPLLQSLREQTGGKSNEFCRVAERTGVALARQGKLDEARTLFSEACAWRRTQYAASHPERVRCEAYGILATTGTSPAEKQRLLADLASAFKADRNDRMALADGLRAAAVWLQGPTAAAPGFDKFPLLD
jgi:serine/threonine-protein kinase